MGTPPDPTGPRRAGGGGLLRAAGCVLWRPARGGGVEFALVHRPRWDDWSHPKGKLRRGERSREAALREVREETGAECVLGAALTPARYRAGGRPKQVDYWVARAVGGAFAANEEVDRMLWLPPAAARDRLTRPRDAELLDEALHALGFHEGPPGR